MQDGRRKLRKHGQGAGAFLARNQIALVVRNGAAAGSELQISNERMTLGRGAEADLTLDDPSLSALHLVFETSEDAIRLRDLDGRDRVRVNGAVVSEAALKHGDAICIDALELELVIEERDPPTRIMSFPGE